MAVQGYVPNRKKTRKPKVDKTYGKFPRGYVSNTEHIRTQDDALVDMTNMDLKYGGLATTRPGTTKYGSQTTREIIGIGGFINALTFPIQRFMISMQVKDGVGRVYIRKDTEDWQEVAGSYTFSDTKWATFEQSNNRVYISNNNDYMSFYDIATNTIVRYQLLPTPATPTVTATDLAGSVVTYRIRVSANNKIGETKAGPAALVTVGAYRNSWDPTKQKITITHPVVSGAESYNYYIGTTAGEEEFLGTEPKPSSGSTVTFVDNNRNIINIFKKAPEGDSTRGPIIGNLVESGSQLFGVQDRDNPYRLWYSGSADKSGDFSPFSGGGWVDVGLGSDSIPTAVKAFRDGQGRSAVTILTRGSAGGGGLYHLTFETQTLGDFTITYPSVSPANGQAGTYGHMSVIEESNSLYYLTGLDIKTTGTKPDMVNILVTDSISDPIEPDMDRLSLHSLDKAVGVAHRKRLYWAVPVGSSENNEIWICDLAQRGAWILRWTIPAKYMWLYEDNSGHTHFCLLVNNKIVEFNETALDDDGVPFRTRLATPTLTFDESGMLMAYIEKLRTLLIRPRGNIQISAYGLGEGGESLARLNNSEIKPQADPTGYDECVGFDAGLGFDRARPAVSMSSKQQYPAHIEVDAVVSQISFDITTESASHYSLHSGHFSGKVIPKLYQGDQ